MTPKCFFRSGLPSPPLRALAAPHDSDLLMRKCYLYLLLTLDAPRGQPKLLESVQHLASVYVFSRRSSHETEEFAIMSKWWICILLTRLGGSSRNPSLKLLLTCNHSSCFAFRGTDIWCRISSKTNTARNQVLTDWAVMRKNN